VCQALVEIRLNSAQNGGGNIGQFNSTKIVEKKGKVIQYICCVRNFHLCIENEKIIFIQSLFDLSRKYLCLHSYIHPFTSMDDNIFFFALLHVKLSTLIIINLRVELSRSEERILL
jgi:hypothetical protein